MHLKSAETGNNHVNFCTLCGKVDNSKCYICGFYLHLMANRGQATGRTCFFDYLNDVLFGLARADAGLSKIKGKECNYPSLYKKRENKRIINKFNNNIA